jgi:tetratricopeptide (TPR) repeat protein
MFRRESIVDSPQSIVVGCHAERRRSIFISLLFLFSAFTSFADNTALYNEANELYKKAEYQAAIEKYELVLKSNFVSGELYYNLGNAYFKTNQIPMAILCYERAEKLMPGDEDVEFNLSIANLKIVDKIEVMPSLFFYRWIDSVMNIFSFEGWAIAGIISIVFAMLFFVLFRITEGAGARKTFFYSGLVLFIFTVKAFWIANIQYNAAVGEKTAIIFTPTVNVKSSPVENGTNLFVLHEGTKVELLDKVGEWSKIKLSDGNQGWVETTSFVVI